MLLSIIIPYHNRHAELQELLDSIPNRADIEVIFCNDNSDEPFTPKGAQHNRIIHLNTDEKNRYAGSARNLGIEHATGTWIFFADSDDKLSDNFENVLENLPDVDIVYGLSDAFPKKENSNRTDRYNTIVFDYSKNQNPDPLFRFHAPWAKFIRRDFITKNNLFFDATRVSNDVMFNARLCKAKPKAAAVKEIIYLVRQEHASLTTIINVETLIQRIDVAINYNQVLNELNLRRYRVATGAYIKTLFKKAPLKAFEKIIQSLIKGSPVFPTPYSLKIRQKVKHYRKQGKL